MRNPDRVNRGERRRHRAVILPWSISPHDARAPDTQLGQHGGQARACSDPRAPAGRDVACAGRCAELAALARDVPRFRWLSGVS